MATLRIRENFHPDYHKYSSIQDFDLKWENILRRQLQQKSEIRIKCNKINNDLNCLLIKKENDSVYIETSYFIGLDFISDDLSVIVEPKFDCNEKEFSIDFYKILFESLPYVKFSEDVSNIYHVDFSKPKIEINQKDDFLTPILVVQYISYLDNICHRGLQKGYYWVENNLNNKVKGKILVKETMKKNHLNSNYNKTYCKYQEFGIDILENRFLKFAFQFCVNYLNQFNKLKIINNFESRIGFIKSTFEKVTMESTFRNPLHIRKNPLFPVYESALKLANLILKRNAFNITNTTKNKLETYPYWIDMSKIFELHVLKLLRMTFKDGIYYQKEYSGRIPDIILNIDSVKAVIDVKYKDYTNRTVEIEDIRQVAAYARMKTIFSDLKMKNNEILDAIIIYPQVGSEIQSLDFETLKNKIELNYHNIFKLDVGIPIITNN
jgi:5-methylcytosine-specific restriction enzyme subunit McrC